MAPEFAKKSTAVLNEINILTDFKIKFTAIKNQLFNKTSIYL